ncbi:cyclase family protein [uncultured Aureimonas sp.]|uniref:cyclase family protein n=1 Tax=uncultured Aureimonas sp. TaxID=1604662 RepID=UPI0025F2AB24|nr:cyclase family protein [uncultured Aureimonas sp.]
MSLLADLFDDASDLVDLTHPMTSGMPVWPTHPPFCQEVVESFERGGVACNHRLCLSEHTGTHFDAPVHFIRNAEAISDMPLRRFIGRMATIDATDCEPDTLVEPERVLAFERAHGDLARGDAVFFHFGWDRLWRDPADHPRVVADWPGLSAATCDLLVARGVGIVGTDCLSVDRFSSQNFDAHNILLGAGILIGENFAALGTLPPYARLVALPLAIAGGTGAPARALAVVPRQPGRS